MNAPTLDMAQLEPQAAAAPELTIDDARRAVGEAQAALAEAREAHAAAGAALTEWRVKVDAAASAADKTEVEVGEAILEGATLTHAGSLIAAARASLAAAERGLKAANTAERRAYAESELAWCRLMRAKEVVMHLRQQAQYHHLREYIERLSAAEDGLLVVVNLRVPLPDMAVADQANWREQDARRILAQLDNPPAPAGKPTRRAH